MTAATNEHPGCEACSWADGGCSVCHPRSVFERMGADDRHEHAIEATADDKANPLADIPCPACGATALRIEWRTRVVASPIGTFALAGQQVKAPAKTEPWPWVRCGACGIEAEGSRDA